MRTRLLLLLLVGCGAPPDVTPSNTAGSASVRISPMDALGSLALATTPASDRELASYIPVTAAYPLVTVADLAAGTTVSTLGVRGDLARYTAGARTEIPFGCEQHQLEVTPLAGPRLPPGPAWILPRPVPPTWAPAPLAIAQTRSAETAARYRVGPLTLELTRTAPSRGRLAIERAGRTLHSAPFERAAMDGAPPELATIDLRSGGPGVPAPVGAWSVAPNGPVLLVLLQPGWEGVTLASWLVDDTGARPIEAMTTYLYLCAF